MAVNHVQLLVANNGSMRLEQVSEHVFKVLRAGTVDTYLGHITTTEARDLFDTLGDLLTYLDTAQPDADAS